MSFDTTTIATQHSKVEFDGRQLIAMHHRGSELYRLGFLVQSVGMRVFTATFAAAV